MYDRSDPEDLERYVRRLIGEPIGAMVQTETGQLQGARTRGRVGHLYERYLGIPANSDAGPDIPECGVEVKSVPMKRKGERGGYVPKERTFITAIDYARVLDEPFDGSALDLKTRHTLYVFYEHDADKPISDYRTLGILLHERDDIDEMMLREAHSHVKHAVRQGRAHELSEGDTWGVGAATKDSSGRDIPQPCSSLPARRRAFAWKPQVTARLWQAAKPRNAHGLLDVSAPDEMAAFKSEVSARLRPHVGATVGELRSRFAPHLSDGYKALTAHVSRALVDGPDDDGMETFERLGVTVRTMRVDPSSYRPKEAVSFKAFEPRDLATQEWESSDLLTEVRSIFFLVFTEAPTHRIPDAQLLTGFFWEPATADLATMKREWTRFRDLIAAGRVDALPGSKDTDILHVRPHGRDKRDVRPLPNGVPWQTSSFWLNQGYLQDLVRRARAI